MQSFHTRDFALRHPELSTGEALFRNMTRAEFDAFPWQSKRLGEIAYDGEGRPCNAADWHPVFVQNSELRVRRTTLRDARHAFRTIPTRNAA